MVGAVVVIVKLTPVTLAEIVGGAVAGVVLQVTPNSVPRLESSCTKMCVPGPAAVVLTTTVVAAAATTTLPVPALVHTAGDTLLLQSGPA